MSIAGTQNQTRSNNTYNNQRNVVNKRKGGGGGRYIANATLYMATRWESGGNTSAAQTVKFNE